MSLQKKNVTIVAEEASENENAPSHRVFVAKAEIGACWQKTSKEGRDYLSIKLDDPSFTAPIFASLFADEDVDFRSRLETRFKQGGKLLKAFRFKKRNRKLYTRRGP